MSSLYYDWHGQPITQEEWVERFATGGARRVAHTADSHAAVSTVWLGLDHSFGDGPPLIFETMVFGGDHDGYQQRYPTLKEAQAGHVLVETMVFGVIE